MNKSVTHQIPGQSSSSALDKVSPYELAYMNPEDGSTSHNIKGLCLLLTGMCRSQESSDNPLCSVWDSMIKSQ